LRSPRRSTSMRARRFCAAPALPTWRGAAPSSERSAGSSAVATLTTLFRTIRRPEPMSDPLASELDFAVELAVRAGHVLIERFGNLDEGVHKGPRDVVTEADTASERLIIAAIEAAYPADDVLAEESGWTKGRAGSRRTWVIDPLDGTVNYANGIPLFS